MVDSALAKQGMVGKAVERWKMEMPSEQQMRPKDKYTMFDRKEKKYRKGVHSECSLLIETAEQVGGYRRVGHRRVECGR